MKAGELTLQGTLAAQQQYVIPIFQRFYSWGRTEWEQLWSDIIELRDKPGKRHFMGALVFVPDRSPVTYSYPTYQVIDGQQRMITLSLLLAALRNLCKERGYLELAGEITNSVLVHQYKKGNEQLRVYPRQLDRSEFKDAVLGKSIPEDRIGKALQFFTEALNETIETDGEDEMRAFYNFLITGLEFVHINLDGESPYKIFSSLNSTGVDLSPADLIRNFVFMHVSIESQDEFDSTFWMPFESRFKNGKNEINSKQVSEFLRTYLLTTGQYFAPVDTFEAFESRFKDLLDARQLALELTRAAVLYDSIRGATIHCDPETEAALKKLRQLDSSAAYPLVLRIMQLLETGQVSKQQLISCLDVLAGFIFRRYICGESSRTHAKWFVSACKEIDVSDPSGSLEKFLTARGSFPSEARFKLAFCQYDLYDSKYAFSVLQQLEASFGNKEAPDPNQATIEHVMPQMLSKEWKDDLGPNARDIREKWLHTPGNLTFTGYNTGLGNKRFVVKCQGVGETPGYSKSNFELTKMLLKNAKWGAEEIELRGKELAERAAEVWGGPKLQIGAAADGVPENPFAETGSRAKLFNILLDGQWHSIATIQEQYRWDVPHRVERLRHHGNKTGRWRIETEGDQVRMVWPGVAITEEVLQLV
jgi:Protein of unknown function DUF262/Protein of unknown function (DUF1524)